MPKRNPIAKHSLGSKQKEQAGTAKRHHAVSIPPTRPSRFCSFCFFSLWAKAARTDRPAHRIARVPPRAPGKEKDRSACHQIRLRRDDQKTTHVAQSKPDDDESIRLDARSLAEKRWKLNINTAPTRSRRAFDQIMT